MRGARENQQGESSREETFKKVLVPGAGTEAAAARTAGGAHQGGGETGSTDKGRGASGPARGPRARGRVSREILRLRWKTGEPSPPNHPTRGGRDRTTRAVREEPQLPKGLSLSLPGRGSVSPEKWDRSVFFSPLLPAHGRAPYSFPQPAGGATGQQREPVSLFITSWPPRQRWIGGDCRPLYVSSITPASRPLRRRRLGPPPAPLPAHTRGPRPPPTLAVSTSWWSLRPRGGAGGRAWDVTRLRKVLATPPSPWLPRVCPAPFHQVI